MKAVILAAGRGSRLKPLTDEQPKPFVKIVGVHLIESILDNLIKLGITEAVIAVGYLKEYFYSYLGSAYKTMQIQYVEVPEWETVNNSVTLLKTENAIGDDGFILVEGDEYFLDAFLPKEYVLDEKNYWVGTKQPETGSLLHADDQNKLVDLQIVRDPDVAKGMVGWYKSCGVVKIARAYKKLFFERLGEFVNENAENKNQYYDIFIRQHITEFPITLHLLPESVIWGEIDTPEDIKKLEVYIEQSKKLSNYLAENENV